MITRNSIMLVLSLLSTPLFGQQDGFFQTLAAHGSDATYKDYYSLHDPEKDGTYQISGLTYEMTIKPRLLEGGNEKIGFEASTPESTMAGHSTDVVIWDDSLVGFPYTYMIYDKKSDVGYVFIEDYLFKLEDVNLKDLSYKGIDAVMIRKGSGEDDSETTAETSEEGEQSKGKLRGRLNALKDKVASAMVNPDLEKLSKMNIDEYISNYLKDMKAKNDSYTMTASETAEWNKINLATIEYAIEVESTNNAYWASPAGQETLRRMRAGQEASDAADKCRFTLKNDTGQSIYIIIEGSKNTDSVLHTKEFKCDKAIYYSNNKAEKLGFIGGGDQSYGGRTIDISNR